MNCREGRKGRLQKGEEGAKMREMEAKRETKRKEKGGGSRVKEKVRTKLAH